MRAAATGCVGAIAVRITAFGNRGLRGRAQSAAHTHKHGAGSARLDVRRLEDARCDGGSPFETKSILALTNEELTKID